MRRTGSRNRVIVFAKAPQPGAVKTRLIPMLGAQGAAALHARLVKKTLSTASMAVRDSLELHVDSMDDDFLRCCSARYDAKLVPQRGADLGERMCNAFEDVFAREGCTCAVLIGCDCPALTARHLRTAIRALQMHDAAFSPAEDGGYVLVGLARPEPRVFEGIEWGSARVMQQTRERLRHLHRSWFELETLWDVDRPADAERYHGMQADPVERAHGVPPET